MCAPSWTDERRDLVRDTLAAAGCQVQIAHAREVRDVAPLACKTDKVAGHGTAAAHSVVTRSG
jgi:hypothetical protein